MLYQDLSRFSLSNSFIGRSKWVLFIWHVIQITLFRFSPQPMYGWRRFLLRLFGASIGRKVIIRSTVDVIYPWNLIIGDYSWVGDYVTIYSIGKVTLGSHVVISQKSYLCGGGHDHTLLHFPTFEKPITIHNECWIGTDVFIGPGVEIGLGAVVGARSSVYKNIEGGYIYVGNPAQKIKTRGFSI